MKSKTTTQLSEIGKTTEAVARLKSDLADKTIALQVLDLKGRTLAEELRTTEAQLTVKTDALTDLQGRLATAKAEFMDLMTFIDARDKLAEVEGRHTAAMENLRAEKAQLEVELARWRNDYADLQHDMETMKKQVESTWASERMANALLRERINDVAGEVVRVAHALEGLGSPIETMLAGKLLELNSIAAATPGGHGSNTPSTPGSDDSKGLLAHRLRSLQKRAARVASSGGT
jgi:chromosome segregation ATPase